jgi:predicted RNase H-like nuclease
VRFLGVDLAWGEGSEDRPANYSGVVALEPSGEILEAGWTVGLYETQAWIERHASADTLLFVDAPLVISNLTRQRLADKQVGQRYGRWWVSANSVNLGSPRQAGVRLRERLEAAGWSYGDGRDGPPRGGRWLSECYPYATIVGAEELGYEDRRPAYKRKPKRMRTAEFLPIRNAACDELICRVAGLASADPPIDLISHPVTRALVAEQRR